MAQDISFKDLKTIFVSQIDKRVSQAELYNLVSSLGLPKNELLTVLVTKSDDYEKSIAYINTKTHESAKFIIDNLNGCELKGSIIRLSWALNTSTRAKQDSTNIFIKNVKKTVTPKEFQAAFEHFGDIYSCKLSLNENNESNGFGYVNFTEEASIEKVIAHKEEIKNKIGLENFDIQRFNKKEKLRTNLYVGNIDENITEEEFIKYFENFGPIRVDKQTGKKLVAFFKTVIGKNKGYVNFENVEYSEKALASSKLNVLGQGELIVDYYKTKSERKREWKKRDLSIKKKIASDYKEFNLYIDSKYETISKQQVEQQFADCGDIFSIKVKYNKDKKPEGIFYLCMKNAEDKQRVFQRCEQLGWKVDKFRSSVERLNRSMPFNVPFAMPFGRDQPMNYNIPMMNNFFSMMMNPQFNMMQNQFMMQNNKKTQGKSGNQKTGRSNKSQRKPIDTEENKTVSKVPAPEPEQPKQAVAVEQITEEMRNELGDKIYDYILEAYHYDDGMTGRITGVLLESIDYSYLNAMLNERRAELDAIINEIRENLEKMPQEE